jgi:D-beta-D-heptose 7-phosphate kinase/D-beta-D-heptose 1-phosphate adenosyltransferase
MNIIILGDIMIDINYQSEVNRNAPEADIPIYNILGKNYILGGAANVALNLKNLGTDIELIGLIGNDSYGKTIKDLLDENEIKNKLFIDSERNTTQKNRIFFKNQLNVRYDIENTNDIPPIIQEQIIEYVKSKKNIDAIIISDYDKGFITEYLCQTIIQFANNAGIPTFIDPKIKNYLKYTNCFLFKPNIHEAEKISNEKNLDKIINKINEKINCKNLLITRGKEGMIFNSTLNKIEHDSVINLIDVTGAGDVVMSVLVYIYLKNCNLLEACEIANYIAGKSVGVIGNYSVTKNVVDECFEKTINSNKNTDKNNKIIFDYEINKIEKISKNHNIVFTNGCFDILHSGHIKNLQFAKSKGDILVVGLNSDESIKRLKGPERPINDINERTAILSLFDFVDYIIIFSENTPFNVLKILRPNILVKGSDYNVENVVGSEFVKKVILFDYIDGKSSTSIINKIKSLYIL